MVYTCTQYTTSCGMQMIGACVHLRPLEIYGVCAHTHTHTHTGHPHTQTSTVKRPCLSSEEDIEQSTKKPRIVL